MREALQPIRFGVVVDQAQLDNIVDFYLSLLPFLFGIIGFPYDSLNTSNV